MWVTWPGLRIWLVIRKLPVRFRESTGHDLSSTESLSAPQASWLGMPITPSTCAYLLFQVCVNLLLTAQSFHQLLFIIKICKLLCFFFVYTLLMNNFTLAT